MNLRPNLVEGSSTSKLHRSRLVTHGFVRNCEPSEEVTNAIPISKFDRFIRGFAVVSNWDGAFGTRETTRWQPY